MSELDGPTLSQIAVWVWSGCHARSEIHEMAEETLEPGDDAGLIHRHIDAEMDRKEAAELTWPAETDCDRIERVFDRLRQQRLVVLQNAGMTMSDGLDEVGKVLAPSPTGTYLGYCFYHGQDLERAIDSNTLVLAYGDLQDTESGKRRVAESIVAALEQEGFTHSWKGNVRQRLMVTLTWQRRGPRPFS